MCEKIIKPDWLINFRYVKYSWNISKFMNEFNINDLDNINIDFLRKYYKKNKEQCLDLIDELTLRGFKFDLKKHNNLLKNIDINEENSVILVSDNKERYKNIDFNRIGLSNFIKRFKVNSDYFFNYIKLDYFTYLNKDINMDILKDELKKNNIKYFSCDECKNIEKKENVINSDSKINKVKVENIFIDNEFNIFLRYCKENNIVYIDDLDGFDFDELYKVKGLGKLKISKIISIYNKLKNEDLFNKINKDSPTKIEDVFNEKSFITYCKDNNMIYIDDLNGFDVTKLYEIKGLGELNINKIISICKGLPNVNLLEEEKISINKSFYKSNVATLFLLGVKKKTINDLKKQLNISKLQDIQNYKLSELTFFKGNGETKNSKLINAILLLRKEPSEIYINVFNTIKENPDFDIYKLRCKKITLEQIGNQKGCTRERIRQRNKKIESFLKAYFDLFNSYFIEFFKDKECITDEDILSLFNEHDNLVYIKNAIKNDYFKGYKYIKELNMIVNEDNINMVNSALYFIKENIPDIFKIEDEIDNINDILISYNIEFVEVDQIIIYLIEYAGYKKIKEYLWKGRDTKGKLCAFIVKEYFPNGINIYTDELKRFKLISYKEFGIDMDLNDRTIQARITSSDQIVLCDRGKYIYYENIRISKKLLNEIKQYIDSNEVKTIAMVDLFSKFKDRLQIDSNIDNRYFLQGVIKYYYEDEYQFTRDTISRSGEIQSCNKILEEILYMEKGCVGIKKLKEKLPGWTPAMFANAVYVNDNILLWDYGLYIHRANVNISDEEINKIKQILDSKFTEDIYYISIYSIFKTMKLKMNNMFKNNKISTPSNLFYLLYSFLKDDYVFKRNIIYKKGLDEDKYKNVFEIYVNERKIINYNEFVSYFRENLKLKDCTIYSGFKRVKQNMVQIDLDDYIKVEDLNLYDENIQKVKKFIDDKLYCKKYLSIYTVINFNGLPNIGCEWSFYLLTEIIDKYIPEFRIIEPKYKDKNNRRPIVVEKNSEIKDIVDFIIYVVKYEYNDPENLTISKIRDYLNVNNIFAQSIPDEFYESEKILVDEYGRVSIKEN